MQKYQALIQVQSDSQRVLGGTPGKHTEGLRGLALEGGNLGTDDPGS